MTDKVVNEHEFYTEVIETIERTTIEPNMDKLRSELVDYIDGNLIDGDQYKFNNVVLHQSRVGQLEAIIDFDLVSDDGQVEPIDENFSPSEKFEAFLESLTERYKVKIDYPYWYLPK